MQFHLNGFRPGDPEIAEKICDREGPKVPGTMPDEVDVLIIGCGPAGLTLAAQLSSFPELRVAIAEQKSGPLEIGQADGISCRSMEMYEALGISGKLLNEAHWVNETVFWRPDEKQRENIVRSGRVQDTEDGISEFPHVILSQARVQDLLLDVMCKSARRLHPAYNRRFRGLTVSEEGRNDPYSYPVTVEFERLDPGHEGQSEFVRARYVVGCDGARSAVRTSIGRALVGDPANQAWGVMDVLAVTDYPDIRPKSLIQSAKHGNIIIIPREGGYMVRVYIELDKLEANERVASKNINSADLVAAAKRIFKPFTFDVKEVAWWSVYEIGQRLCDKFDDVPQDKVGVLLPRVFIAGDACHTHSPKAGQGMNVSVADAFNLGWKLAAVVSGTSPPELLHTYSCERQAIARELIEFDKEWAKMVSTPPKDPTDPNSEGVDPEEFRKYFLKQGRFTAGTSARYQRSTIVGDDSHQALADGLTVGMRFHSAPVIRLSDAKPMHLGHVIKADGRWRLFAFAGAGDAATASSPLAAFCHFLADPPNSLLRKYTPIGADIDSVIDVRAIFQQHHHELEIPALPQILRPHKGRYALCDYEKVFCADRTGGKDIFDMRAIDRDVGCVVIVRPDQFVANVLPLDAHADIAAFFAQTLLARC